MYTLSTKKNEVKEDLIKVALELLKDHSYDKITIKGICDKVGVTRNAFYYYFSSLGDLFNEASDWISESARKKIHSIFGEASYFQQFWEFYRVYLQTEIDLGANVMNHVCFVRTSKENADYFSYVDDDMAAAMCRLIEGAQKAGQIKNSMPAEDLLWTSYAIVRGENLKWCFRRGETDLINETKNCLNVLFLPEKGYALK